MRSAVQTPSGIVKTGAIAPGASATLTVDAAKAGSYTFFCPIPGHRQAGMQGTLVGRRRREHQRRREHEHSPAKHRLRLLTPR